MNINLRICNTCVLPENYPGIKFDAHGTCNLCCTQQAPEELAKRISKLKSSLERHIAVNRGLGKKYDVIVAYSGGKDSSYTLFKMVEEYRLNVLAITVDNGFVSDHAFKNIRKFTSAFNVDSLIYKPANKFMKRMYKQSIISDRLHTFSAIKRASDICSSCINLINNYMVNAAINFNVPMIAGGYIGGQVPKDSVALEINFSAFTKTREKQLSDYVKFIGPEAKKYFAVDRSMADDKRISKVTVLNPMLAENKKEAEIVAHLGKYGWEHPRDTGLNSSNCQLNDLGIASHYKKYGFHPYVLEISESIRAGTLSRAEGLKKVAAIPSVSEFKNQLRELDLSPSQV